MSDLEADRPHDALEYLIDPRLKQWATARAAEYIDAWNEHGSSLKAAIACGVNQSVVSKAVKRARVKAAIQGFDPAHDMHHTVREPFAVKGTSTYYNSEGKPTQQWVKTRLNEETYLEIVREAVQVFLEDVPPLAAPTPPEDARVERNIIPFINIGDGHLGMLAHEAEVGESFDLKIAERELCMAIHMFVEEWAGGRRFERIVCNDLGDMTHYENMSATTEHSGHQLDFDSRFPRMIRVYSRVMRYLIDRLLTVCDNLDVINNQGNHSRTNDIWMAELLRVAYGHTGRVNVLDNDSVFIGYRMGRTLVVTHHGDKTKPADLSKVMANDFAVDWGETLYRYVYMGHVHHAMALKEFAGCSVESFNTLAGKDRYAHDGGWRSRQSITAVFLSRLYGEVGRRTLSIEEIRDRILNGQNDIRKSRSLSVRTAFRV